MNRSEALAPIMPGQGTFPMIAGALFRGRIRRAALNYNVDYYEDKGLLDSKFIFRGPSSNIQEFLDLLRRTFEND